MFYIFAVFMYRPKFKYGGFITEGHYLSHPKLFATKVAAKRFMRTYKHASYLKRIKVNL